MSEVVALFSTRSEAERATDELLARGYDPDRVGYLDRYRDESGEIVTDEEYLGEHDLEHSDVIDEATKGAAGGAVGGAAVGAGAGLLTSAGLLLVPGFGPFLAAGTLAATLGGAGIGAAGGGMVGGVTGAILGVVEDEKDSDETARFYRAGVTEGRPLVSVDVEDADAMEAASLLRAAGAERVDVYGEEGWFE
ncbi:MAG TPA: signal transduction histidine kinase LytS [Acidimicrobiia bacterium]